MKNEAPKGPDRMLLRQIRDSQKVPQPVPDAEWQAGVTLNAGNYRVFLNGQPVPGAVAANSRIGWVDVIDPQTDADRVRGDDDVITKADRELRKRLTGYVEIRRSAH